MRRLLVDKRLMQETDIGFIVWKGLLEEQLV